MRQEIKQLSQIDHVLHRPSMYIGSIVEEEIEDFVRVIQDDEKYIPGTRKVVPGLLKVFNEFIDNGIDEYVRTKGKFATSISVKMTRDTFECSDNGRGIPNTKMLTLKGENKYQSEVAFTEMLSGANYENDDEATIGTNGLGAKAGSIFSIKSTIKNDDGKKCIQIDTKNHLKDVSIKELKSSKQGVHAKIWPDLEYFGLSELNQEHFEAIRDRLLHLSVAYPAITFRFNGKVLRLNRKKYFELFSITETFKLNDNVTIGIGSSSTDNFEHFSLVNGLITRKGGTHVKVISDGVIKEIREKLVKRFKTIKPADIKNKLRVVVLMDNFLKARNTSQTKEDITNSESEIKQYLGNVDYKKISQKILKNDDIMLPITEYFTLKEQAKENAELKKLKKNKKKITSEKYLPATENKKVLFLCEGASAVGGLMPALGRENFGYFELRGVPLNAYDATHKEFMRNPELPELLEVIENEDYDLICTATDADADGSHIKGLLIGFIEKYKPELLEQKRFAELKTPVQIALKNKKPVHWIYEIGGTFNLKKGETGKYMKGLGSYKPELLKAIVQKDGIDNMITLFDYDDPELLDNWLNGKKADVRKEYISQNEFDITGI